MWNKPWVQWAWYALLGATLGISVAFGPNGAHGVPTSYPTSIHAVLVSEGSEYTNDPRDPGGPTKWGVTLHDVRQFMKPNATAADVRKLTREQAELVFRLHYWNAVRADELPAGVDYTLFDYAIISGTSRAVNTVRAILGQPGGAARLSDADLAHIAAADQKALIAGIWVSRQHFMEGLRTFPHFGRGWTRRNVTGRAIALSLAGFGRKGAFGQELDTIPRHGPGKAVNSMEDFDDVGLELRN